MRTRTCSSGRDPFTTCYARRSQTGLTLHELILTLAVVGSLTTAAIPSLQEAIARQRMVTAVNTLITALHLARSEAIRRGERVSLCPSQDGETCLHSNSTDVSWHFGYMLYHNRNLNQTREPEEPVLRHFGGLNQLQIYSSRYRDNISYFPTGQSPGSNATFLVCDPHGRAPARQVVLSNSGRVRVETSTEICPSSG